MQIAIESEIGVLRRVLVHRPGDEIIRMTQHDLDLMLFDDILAPDETVREHDLMVGIMREAGAEVLELAELLTEALAAAPSAERYDLIQRSCEQAGAPRVAPSLMEWSAERLAKGLLCGVYWTDLDDHPRSLARIRAELDGSHRFALPPVPNLMFMRDPCMAVFDRVVVGRMATAARAREPLLVSFALRHAPGAGAPLSFVVDQDRFASPFHALEGGDLLVLSPHVIMIGCSMRTNAQTIQCLAEDALFPAHPTLQRIYAVMMPEARSVMHLDTILTHVDRDLFLGHEPLLAGRAGRAGLPVARLARGEAPKAMPGATVLDVLQDELGRDMQLIPCGGDDPLYQEREQWTDGANAVAVGPGHIILYARNSHTIETLVRKHDFEEVRVSVVQPPEQQQALVREGLAHPRTVFSFSGSELSRARGGGRCLTMPLAREPLRAPSHDGKGDR